MDIKFCSHLLDWVIISGALLQMTVWLCESLAEHACTDALLLLGQSADFLIVVLLCTIDMFAKLNGFCQLCYELSSRF